jgi:hypothetical protein
MLKTFEHEKHAHMYLVYGSCDGNGSVTVGEHDDIHFPEFHTAEHESFQGNAEHDW